MPQRDLAVPSADSGRRSSELISEPFIDGLRIAFTVSLMLFRLAAAASWMRGAMPPGPLDAPPSPPVAARAFTSAMATCGAGGPRT